MKSLTLKARAKINVSLRVGPRRKDGYHSLDTEFQEIELFDTLVFRRTESPVIQLTVEGAALSAGADNLIVKALTALRAKVNTRYGIRVHLIKRIPMGAGLGGGSSDAAAALKGGWAVWTGRALGSAVPSRVMEVARKLGADVPFFLWGGRARGRGVGDKLTRLPAQPRRWLVVVHPKVGVSTPKAYAWLDAARAKKSVRSTDHQNDFEPVVIRKVPVIGRVVRALRARACNPVFMSGSGSAVVGFVSGRQEGERVRRALRKSGWSVWVVQTTR